MVECVEELVVTGGGPVTPSDISPANPNNIEFDNLYLDMNGIIHPCTHPEDAPAPTTEEEMFSAVFDYIDRIVSIVRPRKLLYMAIDGVAPRAKINQQRSRRFRASKEAEQKLKEAEALKSDWRKRGLKLGKLPDSADWIHDLPKELGQETIDADDAPFDSNVITPGTPFMERLAVALKEYAARRISSMPGWENLRILFSDASVPGEGEHKIAEYIRVERATPGYDPNISHVLYGLDADLIMLALATHEVHFSVLREEVFPKRGNDTRRPGGGMAGEDGRAGRGQHHPQQINALMASAESADAKQNLNNNSNGMVTRAEVGGKKPFQFLHINVLREYIDLEFRHDVEKELEAAARKPKQGSLPGLVYNLENVIDDFVFLCFFVGNDFLPHLPTLDIREGAIDYLIEVYKTDLPHVGYLTSGAGDVDFTRVKRMLSRVGAKEDIVFQERMARERSTAVRDAEHRKRAAEAKDRREEEHRKKKEKLPESVQADGRSSGAESQKVPALPAGGWGETIELGRDKSVGKNQAAAGRIKRALEQRKAARKSTAVPLKHPQSPRGGKLNSSQQGRLGVASSPIAKQSKEAKGHASPPTAAVVDEVGVPTPKPPGSDMSAQGGDGPMDAADAEQTNSEFEEKSMKEFEEELKQRLDAQKVIENPSDNVRLGESGWKERYYLRKFNWTNEDGQKRERLFHVYLEGLYWVMKYYYVGCISWGWYYPYHYAPFASDIVASSSTSEDIHLDMGQPFRPFTQLQAVMPASSGALVLPKCYSQLMVDPNSPIIDYYPADFEVDLNGKRFAWQGVALLPFIDEKRLSSALTGLEAKMTESEKKRNSFGHCMIVCNRSSSLGKFLEDCKKSEDSTDMWEVTSEYAEGQLFGKVSNVQSVGQSLTGCTAVGARFELPKARPHVASLLPGASAPSPVLDMAMKAECSQRGGWKPARHGTLGRAARELSEMRKQRVMRGRGGYYNRGRGRGFDAGYVRNQAPIHPQVNPAANAMFDGLGASAGIGQGPSWMNQGYQSHPYPQQQYGYGAPNFYGHSQYGAQNQTYGAAGYNSPYGAQGSHYPGDAYQGQYQYGGSDGSGVGGGYNFSTNPGYYAQQQYGGLGGGAGGTGAGGTGVGGRGLAGPTAMQMRQAVNPSNPQQGLPWSQPNNGFAGAGPASSRAYRGRGRGRGQ